MNEIEKMYENANVEKEVIKGCYDYYSKLGIDIWKENDCRGKNCDTCKKDKSIKRYPPFTSEKQLKLIKWLAINKEDFGVHYRDYDDEYRWVCGCEFEVEVYRIFNEDETFEESLAGLINMLWQNKIFSLTAEEKQQIKEILK